MGLNLRALKRRAKEYVESQARTKVMSVRFAERFVLFGKEDVVLSVRVSERTEPEWWVIGGATPMNLYAKSVYPDADTAFSLHQGLMLRIADRHFTESKVAPDSVGYDAFISHASEDKAAIVRPLAKALSKMGFSIWYDEFTLKVGDSLRRSIDRGLVNSRFGIVVLLKAFFAKNWPQYELTGLITREIDGERVILPIWHGVSKQDVLKKSPTLADKVALSTGTMSIPRIAKELAQVLRD